MEEIPPLQVFYSPKHRVVVKRQRKRRRIEPSSTVIPSDIPMDIVWKDTQTDPSENLTKFSQFTGAYASATIDKVAEVRKLIREKEERIQQLEQQLVEERQSLINKSRHNCLNSSRSLIN